MTKQAVLEKIAASLNQGARGHQDITKVFNKNLYKHIRNRRYGGMVAGSIVGAGLGAGAGYLATKKDKKKRTAATVAGGLAGGIGGFFGGRRIGNELALRKVVKHDFKDWKPELANIKKDILKVSPSDIKTNINIITGKK